MKVLMKVLLKVFPYVSIATAIAIAPLPRRQELGARRLGITALETQLHELRGAELREQQLLHHEKQRLQEEQRKLQRLNTQAPQRVTEAKYTEYKVLYKVLYKVFTTRRRFPKNS